MNPHPTIEELLAGAAPSGAVPPSMGAIAVSTSGGVDTISYPAATPGDLAVAGYALYVGTAPGAPGPQPVATRAGAGAGAFTHPTPPPGRTYYYSVRASDVMVPPNVSARSAEVSVATPGDGATPVPATVPDPGETVFTLTEGGVVAGPSVAAGLDLQLASVLRNNGLPLAYGADAVLAAAVWRGPGEPVLLVPSVAWIDPAAGSFSLGIDAAQTAGLDPGVYRIRVTVTALGVTALAFDGVLEVLGVPGGATLRTPYVTAADLAYFYPHLETLQAWREDDAGFLSRRARASEEFDRCFLERYENLELPGFVKRRGPVMETAIGLGWDVPDPTAVPPTPDQMAGYLGAGGLLLVEPTGARAPLEVREVVSLMTLAEILRGRETAASSGRNAYRDEAQAMTLEADRLRAEYDVLVDTDGDGHPDLRVGRGQVVLLT